MPTATKKSVSAPNPAYPSRRAQRYEHRKAQVRNRIIGAAVGVALLAIAVVIGAAVLQGDEKAPEPPFVGTTIDVVLGDYTILGNLTAAAGAVRLNAVNQGGIVHNVGLRRGPISGDMQPGGAFTVDLGVLAPGNYELYCDIVDHVKNGMVAQLVVQ